MNAKAEKWQKFLEDNGITCFAVEEIKNEIHTTVFRAFMEVSGQRLPTMVVLDDSIYSMLQVRVAEKVINDGNRAAVNVLFNELNKKYKVFKYYEGDNGDVCLDSCMPSTGESFDVNIIHAVLDVVLKHLTDEFPNLMRKIWGN